VELPEDIKLFCQSLTDDLGPRQSPVVLQHMNSQINRPLGNLPLKAINERERLPSLARNNQSSKYNLSPGQGLRDVRGELNANEQIGVSNNTIWQVSSIHAVMQRSLFPTRSSFSLQTCHTQQTLGLG
jgi:hypothetical protein